jgi:hypothetical protein
MKSAIRTLTPAVITALALLGTAQAAHAQAAAVLNPGFEEGRTDPTVVRFWRMFNGAKRRFVGDGFLGPAGVTPHTGNACVELPPGDVFSGLDTNVFNGTTGLYNDPAYAYGCGPVTFSAWYLVPTTKPLLTQSAGIKMEFRRPNSSVYEAFENLTINGPTFADGQWHKLTMTISQADYDYNFNYYNAGVAYPEPPNAVSLLPFRFGSDTFDQGTIYWDDVEYTQFTDPNTSPDVKIWDDRNVRAFAVTNAGVQEPSIPVFLNSVTPSGPKNYRVGAGCATLSTYDIIEISDAVPNSGGFPLTFADIVANGYVRPLVQKADGTTTAFGTSVVTHPSFRPNGGPIDTVPDMTSASLNATWVPQDPGPPAGPAKRASPFSVTGNGSYSGVASLTCTREYPDPAVGASVVNVTYTWTANQTFTLPTGRGNDAFRLFWLSSMLGNLASGQYDANFLAVTDANNKTRTIRLTDSPRNVYLYPAPQPVVVGGDFTLYKDTAATWNPGSPSIKVKLVSISGAAGALGVQGYLAPSTNPNDDSLNVWLEWVGAPATVNAGTVITATFQVTATPATPKGDANHDGVINCADVTLLNSIFGKSSSAPDFNAYVDMNNDGVINLADHTALNAAAGGGCTPPPASCVGDFNNDGAVNTADLTFFLGRFGQTVTPGSPGDINGDGAVNTQDLTTFLGRFGQPC